MSESKTLSPFIAALLGGLVVLIAVALLAATGVFDSDDDGGTSERVVTERLGGADPSGGSVADIYEQVRDGVVFVEARGGPGNPLTGRGGRASGSGFVIDDEGHIITNDHVVSDAREVRVRVGEDEDPVEAEVLGTDPSTDIALLEVDTGEIEGLEPLELGDSEEVRVGESTIALGSPFGLEGSVTTGIVSALEREIESPNGFSIDQVIQTDAAINPGNSGGPLLDGQGRVIGINAQIATEGTRANSGVGFAIPINTAKEVFPQLEKEGEVERAYLGVSSAELTADAAERLGLPQAEGAFVQEVVEDGPADDAGLRGGRGRPNADGLLRGGDLIVAVNGKKVEDPSALANLITELKPGDEAEIEFFRGDERQTKTVELGERPRERQP